MTAAFEFLDDLVDEHLVRILEKRDFFQNILVEKQRNLQAQRLGKRQNEIDIVD